jgi:hypothetical protein
MYAIEQLQEDLILLMEILPEFCILAKHEIPLFVRDELTKGFCRMATTKELPVWLVFAATVFLDVHHILRDSVGTDFQELKATAGNFVTTLDHYLELSEGLAKPATWSKNNEQMIQRIRGEIELEIIQDAIFPNKVRLDK